MRSLFPVASPTDLIPTGATPLYLVTLLGFASLAATAIAVYRKWRSGEIADDGVLLDRVNADNKALRLLNAEEVAARQDAEARYEAERRERRRIEDKAERWFRQLESAGHTPVGGPIHE